MSLLYLPSCILVAVSLLKWKKRDKKKKEIVINKQNTTDKRARTFNIATECGFSIRIIKSDDSLWGVSHFTKCRCRYI